jgi:hypothetical protein
MIQEDVLEQIRHVRGLVLIRALVAERGASEEELAECDAVIAECRRELAEKVLLAAAAA